MRIINHAIDISSVVSKECKAVVQLLFVLVIFFIFPQFFSIEIYVIAILLQYPNSKALMNLALLSVMDLCII